MTITNLSIYPFEFYPPSPDTLFILPGERWFAQYGVRSITAPPDNKMIALQCIFYNQPLFRFKDLNIDWQTKEFGGPDWSLYGGTVFLEKTYYYHRYTWLSNSSANGLDWLWLFYVSAVNELPVGEAVNYSLFAEIGTQKLERYYLSLQKYLISIDGIRGDVNGDEIVDKIDVGLLVSYLPSITYEGRYTASGLNYGRGIILFSEPDLVSTALINIWVNNASDPLVQELGIGELMSKRPGNSPIIAADVTSQIVGRTLNIQSATGNVFNVTARLEDGSFWQETKIANSGSLSVEMPEKFLGYKVEAVNFEGLRSVTAVEELSKTDKIPSGFSLYQNYPNPFNPTTTISYSLPKPSQVKLTVYNLAGQEVTTLVDEQKSVGQHEVNFNASHLSSGIYFYNLQAGEHSQTRRMQLLK